MLRKSERLLEDLIEGDVVLDDAAEHRWFLDKLTKHRDLETKIDRQASLLGGKS